jgi:Amt family ammonium transporter
MQSLDILWVTLCAGLVFLMQVGFLCLETGFTRSKNNINVAVKNLTDFCVSSLVFWSVGFGLMFGASMGGWYGETGFFVNHSAGSWAYTTFFVFQLMFCGAAVTIISGAVAERMKFSSYIILTILISGFIYPVSGHWSWATLFGGDVSGFLAEQGFYDFAGSTVVHSVGGWAALAALMIIGARHGRFTSDSAQRDFQPSNMPLAAIGTIFLFIGWLGFNGGSTLAWNEQVGFILVNTLLAGTAGAVSAGVLAFSVTNRLDAAQFMNGCLGGLVAITAGANLFSSPLAILIGFVGGMVVVAFEELLEYFKIDDAVGAIPVHLGAGIWGTLAVGLYGDLDLLGTGLDRFGQIEVQLYGILIYGLWAFGVTYCVLFLVNRIHRLRVSTEDEKVGLNFSEHGILYTEPSAVIAAKNKNTE